MKAKEERAGAAGEQFFLERAVTVRRLYVLGRRKKELDTVLLKRAVSDRPEDEWCVWTVWSEGEGRKNWRAVLLLKRTVSDDGLTSLNEGTKQFFVLRKELSA